MKGVILAAGKGTRMRAVSLGIPKILLPFGEGTIGDSLVHGMAAAGVSEVLIIVGHMEDQVKHHFGDGKGRGVRISYLTQDEQLGTGHAAGLARDFIGKDEFFLLAYGDIATPPENCSALLADFRKHSPEAALSIFAVRDPAKGAAVYVQDGYMKSLVEKPPKGRSRTHFDNAGIYVFSGRVFDVLDRIELSPRNEYELTDALTLLVKSGYRVRAFELGGFWSNVTSPEDLLDVNRLVIDGLTGKHLTGARRLAPRAEVSPLAIVHHRATLGRCSIGPYSVVSSGARIMDQAELTYAIVCRDVVVGRGAFLDHVLVSPECTIQPGARHVGTEDKVLILPEEG